MSCRTVAPPSNTPEVAAYSVALHARADPIWKRCVSEHINELGAGKARAHFEITPDGRAENIRVISPTGNKLLTDIVLQTIRETRFPPLSAGVLRQLSRPRSAADLDFTVY
jgi:TonB family protein